MLPRRERISVQKFDLIMEKGRVVHSPLFLLRYIEEKDAKNSRFSAVAPQKIAKKAVERNKYRRMIYDSIAPLISSTRPVSGILIAKVGIKTAIRPNITSDLQNLFVKAGLIK